MVIKKHKKLKHKGGSVCGAPTAYMNCSKNAAPHMQAGQPFVTASNQSNSDQIVRARTQNQQFMNSHRNHYYSQRGGYATKMDCSPKPVALEHTPSQSTSVAAAASGGSKFPGGPLGVLPANNTNTTNRTLTAHNAKLQVLNSQNHCVPDVKDGPGALAPQPEPQPPAPKVCLGGGTLKKKKKYRKTQKRKKYRKTQKRKKYRKRQKRKTSRRKMTYKKYKY